MIWTDFFNGQFDSSPWESVRERESEIRAGALVNRRDELRQYELESYAAIGRRVCEALEQGTRSYVDLGHDVVARFVRVIEVATPAYPELSE